MAQYRATIFKSGENQADVSLFSVMSFNSLSPLKQIRGNNIQEVKILDTNIQTKEI